MPSDLVFITGVTGHLGFAALVAALKAGYTVRAAVRSSAKQAQILAAPSIQTFPHKDRLTFVTIPDIVVPGAYDHALQDVVYIIHIASPILLGADPADYQRLLIEPAVAGTTNILHAARKTPSIKRIVITASILSFCPVDLPAGAFVDHNSRIPFPSAPYPSEFHAYAASKVAAFAATEDFVTTHPDLGFDIVNIHPTFVLGKNELVTSTTDFASGTNSFPMGLALGTRFPEPIRGSTVHNDDVAFMHVRALSADVPAGSYGANSGGEAGTVWQDLVGIVEREFPEAVKAGILKTDGTMDSVSLHFDVRKSEEVMGFRFKGFGEQVKSVVGHYLELKAAEGK